MLFQELIRVLEPVRQYFSQKRVFLRFVYFLIALFCATGRRTLTAALPEGQNHTSFYRLFSRCLWWREGLCDEVIRDAVPLLGPKPFIPSALDDTHTKKTGRLRGITQWLFTGLFGRYKPQLGRGLRWVHTALLVFIPGEGPAALTVGFELAQPLKRPKKASAEVLKWYKREAPRHSISVRGAEEVGRLRAALDRVGLEERTLMMVVDGGYMNQPFLQALPERTLVVGRVRKDIRLVYPAMPGPNGKAPHGRVYGVRAPTPEQLRLDEKAPWVETRCYFGGASRKVRYKELATLLWQDVTQRVPVRLIVIAPTPYWLPGKKRKGYNLPAYLLTTDLTTHACILIQTYFERWQIEVVHRDLKSDLGCTQPQVWNRASVHRVIPAMAVFYSFLRIAAWKAFGPGRDPDIYGQLPRYRKGRGPTRASPRDLLRRLRADTVAALGEPIWRTE